MVLWHIHLTNVRLNYPAHLTPVLAPWVLRLLDRSHGWGHVIPVTEEGKTSHSPVQLCIGYWSTSHQKYISTIGSGVVYCMGNLTNLLARRLSCWGMRLERRKSHDRCDQVGRLNLVLTTRVTLSKVIDPAQNAWRILKKSIQQLWIIHLKGLTSIFPII